MRKMKIGIFTVFTVILFFLSTGTSVTATLHQDTYMIMTSNVYDGWPWANVYVDPQDVGGQYNNWEWTVDINDGDDIIIDTTCYYNNYYFPSSPGEGYHYFLVEATYVNGLDVRPDSDDFDITTYDRLDSGSTTISVQFENVDEGGTIYMYWYVQAINIDATPDVDADFENTGTIYLT